MKRDYTWAKTAQETILLCQQLAEMQSVLGGTAIKPTVNDEVGLEIDDASGIDIDEAIHRLRELDVAIALREFQSEINKRLTFSYSVTYEIEGDRPKPVFDVSLLEMNGVALDDDADSYEATHVHAVALARAIDAIGWDPVEMVIEPL